MVVVPVAWASLLRRHHSCFSDLGDNPVSCGSNGAKSLSHFLRKVPHGVRNPAPSCHTCLSASDLQNPWVNLLSAGCLTLSPILPIKPVHCSSEVCFPGSSVDVTQVVEHESRTAMFSSHLGMCLEGTVCFLRKRISRYSCFHVPRAKSSV